MNTILFGFLSLVSMASATSNIPELNKTRYEILNESYIQRNVSLESGHFGWEDYSVLAVMLIISCGIGVFYGYFSEKPTTGDDFLLGGSSMGTFPMALSLAAR